MYSVVIVAYNEEQSIGGCLHAFTKPQTDELFEILLIDNASTDRTSEIAQEYTGRLPLRIIREEKKGRGAARWRGFLEARGDIVLSTDGDTIVPPEWIKTMTHALRKNVTAVAVSGPCRIADCGGLTNVLFNIIQPVSMHLYRLFVGHYWLTGSNFAIRKHVYDASGGFDPDAPSSEDTELSFRVKRIGKIRYIPCAVTSSGRRFRGGIFGLLKGLIAYPWTWIERFVLKKKDADLSDVR